MYVTLVAVVAGQRRGPTMSAPATTMSTQTAHFGIGVRSLPDLLVPGLLAPFFPDESGEPLRLFDGGGGGGSLLTAVMLRADVAGCHVALNY